MIGAKTGKGWVLPLIVVVDIYVIWILTSIVGLAITPIEGKLMEIFPGTTQLMSQMILIGPNVAAIPFIFVGGALATKYNNIKLINWACIFYLIAGVLFFVADSMWMIIILCFACGLAAGVLSPLSVVLITKIFTGKYKTKQLGFTSATLNVFLALAVIATGYLANINWRLPFAMYLLPIVPLLLSKQLAKYLPEPKDDPEKQANVKFSFRKEVNVPALIRYCIFYFLITLAASAISQYIPFLFKNSSTAGNLTSVLFVGIMVSGYMLNFLLKYIRKYAWGVMLLATAIGFFMIIVTHNAWLVGAGIFVASFFYGIGQPYCYDRCSEISTNVASTLCMAWLISMDSFGNIFCPFIVEGIGKIIHVDMATHPEVPFKIYMFACLAGAVLVFIRKFKNEIMAAIHKHEHKATPAVNTAALVTPSATHPAAKVAMHSAVKAEATAPAPAPATAAPAQQA